MLHPKNDQIDYGEQLIPPDGYELERAIGTTYSLDLEALMVLPVALFYAQTLDGDPDKLRYDMLDAITKASEKITVYYQNGHLKVPKKYYHLMAYWEKGIEKVTMKSHLSSFHPKVWIIRYKSKEAKPVYRLMVTSRNLTYARDWDVAFSTDGIVSGKDRPENMPLVHFLNHLNKVGKKKIPPSFIKDLMKVRFDIPEKFDSLKFHPIGISNPMSKKKYPNPISKTKNGWDELLIISPFLGNQTLKTLQRLTAKQPYLLSRKEEMDAIPAETIKKYNPWQFSKFIQEAEFYEELEEEDVIPMQQNLHAKLFVAGKKNIPYWFLGSANCSDPAQGRNIEFMVELKGTAKPGLRAKGIFKVLTNPSKDEGIALFTAYDDSARESTVEQKSIDLDVRLIKYNLSLLSLKGWVELIPGGTAYNLMIEIDATNFSLPKDYWVQLKPLPEQQKTPVTLKPGEINYFDNFTAYAETALSPYLVFEIWRKTERFSHFLLPMEIDLPKNRLNRIFSSIIDSREKFLKYLAFLLSGEETDIINTLDQNHNTGKKGGGEDTWLFSDAPVYERLLIAASRYPDKLKSIDLLIQKLKSESASLETPIISPEFESFWQIFQSFVKSKKR